MITHEISNNVLEVPRFTLAMFLMLPDATRIWCRHLGSFKLRTDTVDNGFGEYYWIADDAKEKMENITSRQADEYLSNTDQIYDCMTMYHQKSLI